MELTVLISVIGVVLSVGTFFIGRTTASRNDGKQEGQILTELGYIKSGVDDMKRKMENLEKNYHNLDGRVLRLEEKMAMYHHE